MSLSEILKCICNKVAACDISKITVDDDTSLLEYRDIAKRYDDQIKMLEKYYTQPLEQIYKYGIKPTFKKDYEYMCNVITSTEFDCNDGSRSKIGRVFSILMLLKHMAIRCKASSLDDELEFIVKYTIEHIETHYIEIIREEGGWTMILDSYTEFGTSLSGWVLILKSVLFQCISFYLGYLRNSGI